MFLRSRFCSCSDSIFHQFIQYFAFGWFRGVETNEYFFLRSIQPETKAKWNLFGSANVWSKVIIYQFVLYHWRFPLRVLLMPAIDSQAMTLHRKWINSRKLPLCTSLLLLKLLSCSSCRAPLVDVLLNPVYLYCCRSEDLSQHFRRRLFHRRRWNLVAIDLAQVRNSKLTFFAYMLSSYMNVSVLSNDVFLTCGLRVA